MLQPHPQTSQVSSQDSVKDTPWPEIRGGFRYLVRITDFVVDNVLDLEGHFPWKEINSVQTRGIVKAGGFTRVLVQNRWSNETYRGFLLELLENKHSWENEELPRDRLKSGLFGAKSFTIHQVCTLLKTSREIQKKQMIIHQKFHDFQGNSLANIQSVKSLPW